MSPWYTLSLGDGVTAPMTTTEIEARFERTYPAAERSAAMAVFTRPESEGRLYCEVMAYFSPAAAGLAREFEAVPCVPPGRSGLKLLAGDEQVWSLLFGE